MWEVESLSPLFQPCAVRRAVVRKQSSRIVMLDLPAVACSLKPGPASGHLYFTLHGLQERQLSLQRSSLGGELTFVEYLNVAGPSQGFYMGNLWSRHYFYLLRLREVKSLIQRSTAVKTGEALNPGMLDSRPVLFPMYHVVSNYSITTKEQPLSCSMLRWRQRGERKGDAVRWWALCSWAHDADSADWKGRPVSHWDSDGAIKS